MDPWPSKFRRFPLGNTDPPGESGINRVWFQRSVMTISGIISIPSSELPSHRVRGTVELPVTHQPSVRRSDLVLKCGDPSLDCSDQTPAQTIGRQQESKMPRQKRCLGQTLRNSSLAPWAFASRPCKQSGFHSEVGQPPSQTKLDYKCVLRNETRMK